MKQTPSSRSMAQPLTAPPAAASPAAAPADWLDERTGWRGLLRQALEERIPGGARWAYVFGSGLLFLLLSQIVTGVFLTFYYVPSADHAHTTVAYITKVVADGAFLRSLHAWGASLMVILIVLHVAQIMLYGAYKGKRELLWLSGGGLMALVLGMAFTGYLLPWDERAYFATAVGTNAISEVPGIGNTLKLLLRAGPGMGTLTLSRFFSLHVFIIPAGLLLFVLLHLLLFRKAGPAGPPSADPVRPAAKTEKFYPRQVLMDAGFALLLIATLTLLATLLPATLGPRANPADTRFIPRPEWYYRPLFQWLKYWEGSRVIIGLLVIPGGLALLFLGLPFFDRRAERRPWRRPFAVGIFLAVLGGLVKLGVTSYRADARNPVVAAQLARQAQQERAYMRQPFAPSTSGGAPQPAPAAAAAALNPKQAAAIADGKKIYAAQGCIACHGDAGSGTAMAPKLAGIHAKLSPAQLSALISQPTPAMSAKGMPPHFNLNTAELKHLVAYVESL